ncbi:MAG: hypothetical protein LBF38_07405 [Deltaproteobacteria bacterium]|jgi:hypothetical protein|nr:hypothetical protein [Deltaproteobacteria bacterium]
MKNLFKIALLLGAVSLMVPSLASAYWGNHNNGQNSQIHNQGQGWHQPQGYGHNGNAQPQTKGYGHNGNAQPQPQAYGHNGNAQPQPQGHDYNANNHRLDQRQGHNRWAAQGAHGQWPTDQTVTE